MPWKESKPMDERLRFIARLLEGEKMAVILQRVVGSTRGDRFYPDFAGVALSQNFYPVGPVLQYRPLAEAVAVVIFNATGRLGRGITNFRYGELNPARNVDPHPVLAAPMGRLRSMSSTVGPCTSSMAT